MVLTSSGLFADLEAHSGWDFSVVIHPTSDTFKKHTSSTHSWLPRLPFAAKCCSFSIFISTGGSRVNCVPTEFLILRDQPVYPYWGGGDKTRALTSTHLSLLWDLGQGLSCGSSPLGSFNTVSRLLSPLWVTLLAPQA